MTEDQVHNIILTEVRALRSEMLNFQSEVRREIKDIHRELGRRDVEVDRLKTKVTVIAIIAGSLMAALSQFVGKVFF